MAKPKPWKTTVVVRESGAPYASIEVELELSIDWTRVAEHFGRACLRNSTGRSGLLGGAIKARRLP